MAAAGPAPCEGNCKFGDPGDGHNPDAYDGSQCGCKQCPNFEICKKWAPPWYFECHRGRCYYCNMSYRKDLEFLDPVDPEERCPVCLEAGRRSVRHPAECGHAVCVQCFKEMWWPEGPTYPTPREFGYVPPPGCPDIDGPGGLAECADDCLCYPNLRKEGNPFANSAMDVWERECPEEFKAYAARCDELDAAYYTKLAARADPKACPVCRAHLKDAPSNSWSGGF